MQIDWESLSAQEASVLLFKLCVEVILLEDEHQSIRQITSIIHRLTQRLHGDYRILSNTPEFKRAKKHVHYFKHTGLGKELF